MGQLKLSSLLNMQTYRMLIKLYHQRIKRNNLMADPHLIWHWKKFFKKGFFSQIYFKTVAVIVVEILNQILNKIFSFL